MQTLNTIGIKPPAGWGSKDGAQEPPDYDDLMAAGSVTPHETGGGATTINFGDLKNSAIYALNVIDRALNEGSLEVMNVGDLPGPLSAVALIELGEGRDQVFLPRLAARGLLNQQIADMFIRQIVDSGESKIELGTRGRTRTFDVKKLTGAYEIEFKYFVKSPKIDLARYSMAQVAQGIGIPTEDIVRDILQSEDPDGLIRRMYYELAAKMSPLVQARRVIKALADSDDDDSQLDAELLATEMGLTLEKVLAGEMTTLQQPAAPRGQAPELLPLLGDMERPNSAKRAADLRGTPRQSGGE